MPERAVELFALAHIDDLPLAQMLLEPVWLYLPDSGEGIRERRPLGVREDRLLGSAALQVPGPGGSLLLRGRRAEMGHVADEVGLADRFREARVVDLLLADAGDGEAAIVVARIDQAAIGRREDLLSHRAIQRARVGLLEIGAAAAADEERIAGECHRAVVEHVGGAAPGVAGRCSRLEVPLAERYFPGRLEVDIGAAGAA